MKLRCKKCRAEKGTSHSPRCEVVRHPWAFTDASTYIPTASDSGYSTGSYDSGCSSDSGSSFSDSSGGGGDCG